MQAKVGSAPSVQNVRVARACAVRSPVKQCNSSSVRSQQVATKVAFADTAETVGLKEEPQKRYILGELLGSGTAAHVHVGTDTATGLQHAVKILPKRKGTKDKTKLIKAEVRISDIQIIFTPVRCACGVLVSLGHTSWSGEWRLTTRW
jgi:serine/threonine protein kinase